MGGVIYFVTQAIMAIRFSPRGKKPLKTEVFRGSLKNFYRKVEKIEEGRRKTGEKLRIFPTCSPRTEGSTSPLRLFFSSKLFDSQWGLISPSGWQLEEGYMCRHPAVRNCTQEPAFLPPRKRVLGEIQGG
jgi:hypothetical protein